MIFGKIQISPHAISRYKQRVLVHRHLPTDISNKSIEGKIKKEIDLRNTMKTVTFGNKYKFVFTKSNTEFRFEKSRDDNYWIMLTVVRHSRLLASEEPLSIHSLKRNQPYGIRTAIAIRESQKEKFEKNFDSEGKKLMKKWDL